MFLDDLASLTSLYRAGSFVALGLLLLSGADAPQRMRPRPVPEAVIERLLERSDRSERASVTGLG